MKRLDWCLFFTRTALTVSSAVLLLACATGTISREEEELENAKPWSPPSDPPAGSPVAVHGRLRVEGTDIVDESGKPVQLKGVSTQWLNWEGAFSRNRDAVLWMRDNWDIKVIRGAMGVAEHDGQGVSGGYLLNPEGARQALEVVIQNAIDAGVYVILDWHDHTAHLHPQEAEDFFAMMAQKWGDYPHVIYETYNEPVGQCGGPAVPGGCSGTDADDPACAQAEAQRFWSQSLKPYHERVLARIRQHDPDGIVLLGNPCWAQRADVAANDPLTDADEPAGDAGAAPSGTLARNVMYTLHFYSCTHGANVRNNGQTALDLGVPVFVSEWGATAADGGRNGIVCEDSAEEWHDWMDEHRIGWAAWRLDACSDSSCFFKRGVPYNGGWTSDSLQGHGPFVVDRLRN